MGELLQHSGREWADVLQSIGRRTEQDDSNLKAGQMLLLSELPIDGDEDVELLLREREQVAVLDPGPTFPRHRRYYMSDEVARQSPVDTLVEQDVH